MEIPPEDARKTVEGFRRHCLINADSCAISGKGQSWCMTPAICPALQACHIIPQQHYHLYPDHQFQNLVDDGDDVEFSTERLRQAWSDTWSNKNGILLMSHLHELFDARLVSIHPDTHSIRAFVPYDVVTEFNGQQANIPPIVDPNALRHHYEMSCIENMAAEMPSMSPDSLDVSAKTTPGIKTPLSGKVNLATRNLDTPQVGDPSKRVRSDEGKTIQPNVQRDGAQEPLLCDADMARCSKRKRASDQDESHDSTPQRYGCPVQDLGQFLADVNWELRKVKASQTV